MGLASGSKSGEGVVGSRDVRAGVLCWGSDIVVAVVVVIFRSGISFEAAGISEAAKVGDVTAVSKAKGRGRARKRESE